MNIPVPERFQPFLDHVDMVLCCAADAPLQAVQDLVAPRRLRFPLMIEPGKSLREHVAAVEFTSHSARFGPFVDNVLGMNWRLPSGTVMRLGERVIKFTTGYDLLRFLLHSGGRFGQAIDYVVRLRPLGGAIARCALHGDLDSLARASRLAIHSPWIHWLDTCDLVFASGEAPYLSLVADCAPGETDAFEVFFRELERSAGVRREEPNTIPCQMPALAAKCPPTEAVALGDRLVREHGGRAVVLCVNGVVHYEPPDPYRHPPAEAIATLARDCAARGGHVSGRWAPARPDHPLETGWILSLEESWNRL